MSERSQAHAAQARADLERAVAALRDSDAWRRNLAVMAQFHHNWRGCTQGAAASAAPSRSVPLHPLWTAPSTRQALMPPKPKEFLIR